MATLRKFDTGEEVRALQRQLAARGFSPGAIDGVFGEGTLAALLAFQRSTGLVPDGIAGRRTFAALALAVDADPPLPVETVTVDIVQRMFPQTPRRNIAANLPPVLRALVDAGIADRPMVLMALATIRAETEGFLPIDEFRSRFNTSPGGEPFDLYDNRADLGNRGKPDGARFKGRGFVQLTGRTNYTNIGARLGVDLVNQPERANEPELAARILAAFLADKETAIKSALAEDDLRHARRLVNGGSHGLDRFTDAYRTGAALLA
jgi:peptidoglycan L-alanyl-D-glutamate endopeptidase CwlK